MDAGRLCVTEARDAWVEELVPGRPLIALGGLKAWLGCGGEGGLDGAEPDEPGGVRRSVTA